MSAFTQNEVKKMRIMLNAEFAAIGKKHGLKLDFGNIRYGDEVRFKLHITKAGASTESVEKEYSPVDKDAEKKLWDRSCAGFGLKPEHFNKTFHEGNSVYTIIGCKPSRPKYPVIVKTGRGARYKMSSMQIKMYCNA